jgi:hypothetical protein
MPSFYEDNDDLRFYVERGIDWAPLVHLTEYDGRAPDAFPTTADAVAFYTEVLELVGRFAAEDVAPVASRIDRAHPTLEAGEVVTPEVHRALFEKISGLGLHGLCLPRELDGMNCPFLLFSLNNELLARADVSVTAHHGFHMGMAMAMLLYSVLEGSTTFDQENGRISSTRFAEAIAGIVSGAEWGSMDITEADAGSDMARLRCVGVLGDDGWRVSGEKIFITSGHGRWHFVIARTEPASEAAFGGLDGLSLFLVPAWSEGPDGARVRHGHLGTVEDKLGHNGSVTVSIRFDDAPAHLVGARGDGFKQMLLLMNNARIGVGFEALGLCEAAYRAARGYAAVRRSMGKTIDRHEMIADLLDELRTEIQGLRALGVTAAWHEEMGQKIRLKLQFFAPSDPGERASLERQLRRHQRAARRMTPLLKFLASEKAVEHARKAIQIHGGSGYIKEQGVEKLLRDAIVFPIYEGTSQIQALMVMKDTLLGVVKDPAAFFKRAAASRWRAVSGRSAADRALARLEVLRDGAIQHLLGRLLTTKVRELRHQPVRSWRDAMRGWDPKRDFALALLHAERLCALLAHVEVASVLYEQVRAHPDRADVLDRWLDRAEPRCRHWHDVITTTGKRLLASLDGAEAADQAAK